MLHLCVSDMIVQLQKCVRICKKWGKDGFHVFGVQRNMGLLGPQEILLEQTNRRLGLEGGRLPWPDGTNLF